MAYKIANIKWLRDQGWSISSSYASGFCPTYNEIVNEIPKGSITVDVNGTCIATSKVYTNNQLVCESDISISSTPTCSCSKINVTTTELNISASSALTQVGTITDSSCTSSVTYESTQSTWLTASTSGTNIRIGCSKNTTINSRNGSIKIKMNGIICATVNVTQNGITCPQYHIVPDKQVTCDGGVVNFSIATNE